MGNVKQHKITVKVDGMPQDLDIRLVDLIAELKTVYESIPEIFRDVASVKVHAYDWEGVECSYERDPTAEEIEARNALFADREQLIARAKAEGGYDDWVRVIRLRTGASRSEAIAYIEDGESDAQIFHPKYDWAAGYIS